MAMKIERLRFHNRAGQSFAARVVSADPAPDKDTFRAIHMRAKEHFAAGAAPAKPEVK